MKLASLAVVEPVIAVVRGEHVLRFDDERVAELRRKRVWPICPTPRSAQREPHVQVVVVVHERHDPLARPVQARRRADVDDFRARREEAVDELLRRAAVDQRRRERAPLGAVDPRVVDVGVEPVLVRRVAEPAVAAPNGPPCGRERSPIPTRGANGCAKRYSAITREHGADEPVGAPAPPAAVGLRLKPGPT